MSAVYRPPGASYDARYLDREERYEIARLSEAGLSIRQIAARLGPVPVDYLPGVAAQRRLPHRRGTSPSGPTGWRRSGSAAPSRRNSAGTRSCASEVQGMLDERFSPEQASGRLKVQLPG